MCDWKILFIVWVSSPNCPANAVVMDFRLPWSSRARSEGLVSLSSIVSGCLFFTTGFLRLFGSNESIDAPHLVHLCLQSTVPDRVTAHPKWAQKGHTPNLVSPSGPGQSQTALSDLTLGIRIIQERSKGHATCLIGVFSMSVSVTVEAEEAAAAE